VKYSPVHFHTPFSHVKWNLRVTVRSLLPPLLAAWPHPPPSPAAHALQASATMNSTPV